MELESEQFEIEAPGVKSLCWDGDTLVDWVAGGTRYALDGTIIKARVHFDYRFDSAIASPSGRFAIIYEKLGTKAILLKDGMLVRELNRSYYHASIYEYPIAFLTLPDGSEAIVHCPQESFRIDIEDAATGRCLTERGVRKPLPVFHSRLLQSAGGSWLASAGWVWHPFDVACLWSLEAVLKDPTLLDSSQVELSFDEEVASVAFCDEERLLVAAGEESRSGGEVVEKLMVVNTSDGTVAQETPIPMKAGTLCRLANDLVLGLYQHPRLFRASDGTVVCRWPQLATGEQDSSILHGVASIPPFAMHPRKTMFAVAGPEKTTVVELKVE
jgi:hypothetical protein